MYHFYEKRFIKVIEDALGNILKIEKIVDVLFEKGLKDNGIDPKDLARIEKEDAELWDKITGVGSLTGKQS